MLEKVEKELLKLSIIALERGEIPVSAIVVQEDKIISMAYNLKETKCLAINHAEILAINKASKKLKNWRLNNCDLYVSLYPCNMCSEVIKEARIKNVYYILENKEELNNIKYKKMIVNNEDQFKEIFVNFFEQLR